MKGGSFENYVRLVSGVLETEWRRRTGWIIGEYGAGVVEIYACCCDTPSRRAVPP